MENLSDAIVYRETSATHKFIKYELAPLLASEHVMDDIL
jgi:hypothetical protein